MLLCVFICSLSAGVCTADSLPSEDDVKAQAAKAAEYVEKFREEGSELRLVFGYDEKLLGANEKERLLALVKKTSEGLADTKEAQAKLKKQIEDYDGEDWDQRYGKTGLWERVESDLYGTKLHKCVIDAYLAELGGEKEVMLRSGLDEVDLAIKLYDTAAARLIRARILTQFAEVEKSAREDAIKEMEGIIGNDQTPGEVKLEMEMLRAQLTDQAGKLRELAEQISFTDANDIELVMSAFSAARKLKDAESLDMMLRRWPAAGQLLGGYVLQYVERCVAGGEEAEVFAAEADIAALAGRVRAEERRAALEYLAGQAGFQSAVVLHTAAASLASSSADKAVALLVEASKVQRERPDERLGMGAEMIAEQGARLAYQGQREKKVEVGRAIGAFDNYARLASEAMEEGLQRQYAELIELSAKDANDLDLYGKWAYRAKLAKGASSEKQLAEVIGECKREGYGDVRADAVAAYCELVLGGEDDSSAEKALAVISENEDVTSVAIKALKSRALGLLGRLGDSVRCMVEVDDCRYVAQAVRLLNEVLRRLEELMEQGDWVKVAADCNSIADFCGRCVSEGGRPVVIAEMILVCDANGKRGLAKAQALLAQMPAGDSVDYIRCRARVLAAQGEYVEAAGLWAQIGNTLKSEVTSEDGRSWQWWRAKYYKLACLAKAKDADKAAIAHAIEVLENSFTDIPPLWAQKLGQLKNQCVER